MNTKHVDAIAKAVLYEGYMLYPYRPSSVKNRQRFNFGVLYQKSYSEAQTGSDAWSMQTECLVQGDLVPVVELKLRSLPTRFISIPFP
jgi:hydrogenase maturation protease